MPNAYYLPAENLRDGHHEDDARSVCHGDDFLVEGTERTLNELDRLLRPRLTRATVREFAGTGGSALYLSSDRLDTMFASKTAMQHVSKPNVLMNARLQRLGRYYEGKPVLVWCYPLQELPKGIRVDGDGDWAPTTELLRRSTSGGAVRYDLHTWDCYSVTQATIALSSSESEFLCDWWCDSKGIPVQGLLVRNGTTL